MDTAATMRDMHPQWRAVADALHRVLGLYAAAHLDTSSSELRLLIPLDFPKPYESAESPVATLFMVPVEYSSAVTVPVLGLVLDLK